jgi:hypothetical protein
MRTHVYESPLLRIGFGRLVDRSNDRAHRPNHANRTAGDVRSATFTCG